MPKGTSETSSLKDEGEYPHRVIFPFLRTSSDQDPNSVNKKSLDFSHEEKTNGDAESFDETYGRRRKMSDDFASTIEDLKKPIRPVQTACPVGNEDMSQSNGSTRMPGAGSLSLIDISKSKPCSPKPAISFPRYPNEYKPPSLPILNQKENENIAPQSILRRNSFSSQCSTKSSSTSLNERNNSIGASFKNSELGDFDPLQQYLGNMKSPDSITVKSSSTPLLKDDIKQMPPRRKSTGILGRKIRFDPQVWVHEYKLKADDKNNMWWSQSEMEKFKYQAVERIRRRHNTFTGSGTGRIVYTPMKSKPRAFYNHPALGIEDEEEDDYKDLKKLADTELKSILIIDPQEIFLRLLSQSLRAMLPNIEITTARTSEEAMYYIEKTKSLHPVSKGGAVHGFDIILAEERLHGLAHVHLKRDATKRQQSSESSNESVSSKSKPILSGSDFFEMLSFEEETVRKSITTASDEKVRFSLLIGISAYHVEDGDSMLNAGASMVWGKPPPPMNEDLKLELTRLIRLKRDSQKITEER